MFILMSLSLLYRYFCMTQRDRDTDIAWCAYSCSSSNLNRCDDGSLCCVSLTPHLQLTSQPWPTTEQAKKSNNENGCLFICWCGSQPVCLKMERLKRRDDCLFQGVLLVCLFVLLSRYRQQTGATEWRKETRSEVQAGNASWYGMHVCMVWVFSSFWERPQSEGTTPFVLPLDGLGSNVKWMDGWKCQQQVQIGKWMCQHPSIHISLLAREFVVFFCLRGTTSMQIDRQGTEATSQRVIMDLYMPANCF